MPCKTDSRRNRMTFSALSLQLVFPGNPGKGKTTIARLLAKINKKIGVLLKGHLVEVDWSDFDQLITYLKERK